MWFGLPPGQILPLGVSLIAISFDLFILTRKDPLLKPISQHFRFNMKLLVALVFALFVAAHAQDTSEGSSEERDQVIYRIHLWTTVCSNRKFTFQLQVGIYYNSLCSDTARFITDQLLPAYEHLSGYIDLFFVPFGKAYVGTKICHYVQSLNMIRFSRVSIMENISSANSDQLNVTETCFNCAVCIKSVATNKPKLTSLPAKWDCHLT